MNRLLKAAAAAVIVSVAALEAQACSRITYVDGSDGVYTGRTMDWSVDDQVEIRLMPRNVERKSAARKNPAQWTSKYGSVIAVSFKTSLNSGMNEKGLVVDNLWLSATDYGKAEPGEPQVRNMEFPLYLLDNFATVEEVVQFMREKGLHIQQDKEPGTGVDMKIHYIVTDRTGDNAILEFVEGELRIHRKKGIVAMTNDPTYDHMQAIEAVYRDKGILKNMPGSPNPADRYVRAIGWTDQVAADEAEDKNKTPSDVKVLSIMRALSTPLGVSNRTTPANCSTLWRTVADPQKGRFLIDSSFNLGVFTIDLQKLDFGGAEKLLRVRPLPLTAAGAVEDQFEAVEPLRF